MAEAVTRKATYADLEAVPEHLVAELIDDVLETHPRPRPRHARAANRLFFELSGPFERRRGGPGGWVFIEESELRLDHDVVVPDVAGWRSDRLATEPSTAYIEVVPDWICEVLSPSSARLDRGPKRRIYAQAGVRHYWLLDPVARELETFSLEGGQWVLMGTIQRGDTVRVAPFDAAPFPLDDLFPFDTPSSTEA